MKMIISVEGGLILLMMSLFHVIAFIKLDEAIIG